VANTPIFNMETIMAKFIREVILDEVEADGASSAKLVEMYSIITFQVTSSSVTTGATVTVEASLDGTNWAVYETYAIDSDTTEMLTAVAKFKYVRAQVSSYTDGKYTVIVMAGE
jgi:hypothetical protein